ncbi:pirin family protein [Spirosoma pollinicola]|uniref:Pirin family protein n=1 Tax=Spirosoma pollinicola TaxID=2057025 RepID=A0A2K8YT64_9BACT|nr:pirin-like C-terminal cupin domain-containing protein [Spirosoma pollinicola]AUD00779.1 pirin family protein [Spirosoma pollinicola]
MNRHRKLVKTYTPPTQPGFLGPGHLASPVIQVDFTESDPFIILMDDRLDKQDEQPVGGPHPHAGFETVSLLLEGSIGDDAYQMKGGDLQLMTAGSGIIHTETIEGKASMRLLQLWLNLPKKDRWATPRVQDLPLEKVPTATHQGTTIKVYSGSLAGMTSPIQNYTPLILADIHLQPGTTTVQHLPASFTTFLYVLEGSLQLGDEANELHRDQVGWLDRHAEETLSELKLTGGETGARIILYAGEPQGDAIVSHGPFIGDTQDDIRRLYQEYRQGKLHHIATVEASQRILW